MCQGIEVADEIETAHDTKSSPVVSIVLSSIQLGSKLVVCSILCVDMCGCSNSVLVDNTAGNKKGCSSSILYTFNYIHRGS
jgi:hypothetical protein